MSKQFIIDNYDYSSMLFRNYGILNRINVPAKVNKFPYNITELIAQPTYKEISLHIRDKVFHSSRKAGGIGESTSIIVFFI